MYFYYRPKTKEIVMRSEGKLESDLPFFEQEPTAVEMTLIEQNYLLYENDGNIRFEKPDSIIKKEQLQAIEDAKVKVKKATTLNELKTAIQSILDNI